LSKLLQTKSGQELREFLVYMSDVTENLIRALRNRLTFKENFNSEVKRVDLYEGIESPVSSPTNRPQAILLLRVHDITNYEVASFGWKFSNNGTCTVKARFVAAPASSLAIPTDLLLIY
jgi:hypothetical protein